MINAIVDRHRTQIERIDALKARHVESIERRIGAPLMMRIDAAIAAEVMPRRVGIKLIELKYRLALDDSQAV